MDQPKFRLGDVLAYDFNWIDWVDKQRVVTTKTYTGRVIGLFYNHPDMIEPGYGYWIIYDDPAIKEPDPMLEADLRLASEADILANAYNFLGVKVA